MQELNGGTCLKSSRVGGADDVAGQTKESMYTKSFDGDIGMAFMVSTGPAPFTHMSSRLVADERLGILR